MHRVCKWWVYIITASIIICQRYACAWLVSIFNFRFWRLALTIQLYSSLLRNLLHSTPSHSTQLDARSETFTGKHEYLAVAASHQLSDQIGVAGSEERCYQSAERRGLVGPALPSFEPCDELRQHQTRIKSTNRTDPGWPGGLLTTLWREEYLALWGGDTKARGAKAGKVGQMNERRKVHSRRQLCKKVQEATIPNLSVSHSGNMK